MENGVLYSITEYFPKDFFNKRVNEQFIQMLMETVLEKGDWKPGNPDEFETDYLFNGVPFEFTLASNSKRKNNFIQRMQRGIYTSDDVESDAISYIEERIADKAKRHYSLPNVHLCVLCAMEMFNWVSDEYGSVTHDLVDWKRDQLFTKIKRDYIETGKFNNVFLLFPDIFAKWWVWDVRTGHKASIHLPTEDIQSGKYPYCIVRQGPETD